MTRKETQECVEIIAAIFPNFKFSKTTIEAWHMIIGDFDQNLVLNAIKRYARKKQFTPSAGDIAKEIQNSFEVVMKKVTSKKSKDSYVFMVKFLEESIAFKFLDKEEANSFGRWLKAAPTKEDVKKAKKRMLEEKNEELNAYKSAEDKKTIENEMYFYKLIKEKICNI